MDTLEITFWKHVGIRGTGQLGVLLAAGILVILLCVPLYFGTHPQLWRFIYARLQQLFSRYFQ